VADADRRADARELISIMKAITGEKPYMWGPSIIGFGTCHYVYDSGREGDAPRAAFSPRKSALVLYIGEFPGREALLKKLGKHTSGKSCIYVKKLADLDRKVLETLIAKSTATAQGC
ncbi:MAG: DUF1801 domain-containing protein, partial [Burkholderiales bacterium]